MDLPQSRGIHAADAFVLFPAYVPLVKSFVVQSLSASPRQRRQILPLRSPDEVVSSSRLPVEVSRTSRESTEKRQSEATPPLSGPFAREASHPTNDCRRFAEALAPHERSPPRAAATATIPGSRLLLDAARLPFNRPGDRAGSLSRKKWQSGALHELLAPAPAHYT